MLNCPELIMLCLQLVDLSWVVSHCPCLTSTDSKSNGFFQWSFDIWWLTSSSIVVVVVIVLLLLHCCPGCGAGLWNVIV